VNQFKANTGASSLVGAMLGAPALAWRIAIHDLGNFAGSDHPLLVLVLLSGLSMVIFWRRAESHLLLGANIGHRPLQRRHRVAHRLPLCDAGARLLRGVGGFAFLAGGPTSGSTARS